MLTHLQAIKCVWINRLPLNYPVGQRPAYRQAGQTGAFGAFLIL